MKFFAFTSSALVWLAASIAVVSVCKTASAKSPRETAVAGDAIRQDVDLIELNHFVDEEGREVFRQLIFYDWSATSHRFHVRAWRLVKHESQLPQRQWKPDGYHCTWMDEGLRREVTAPQMRETWTQQDPERLNRKYLPEDQRVPLFAARSSEEQVR